MTNLLKNGNFEGGWYNLDGIPELQIPNGWQFGYADETFENPYDANPWARFLRPEVRVLPREQLPPWEQSLFILDGDYCLKPFKGSGSLWFWLTQDVDLPAGEYELTVNVYPDVVMDYDEDDQKIFADDPNAALIRFNSTDHWQSINPVPSPTADSRLQTIKHRFIAPGGVYQVRVGVMLPFPLKQNGIFCDAWTLEPVGEPEPPTPEPVGGSRLGTHNIAQANDYSDILQILTDWKDQGGTPAVIKAVNEFGWLAEARDIFPNAPIVARVTSSIEGCQGVENPGADLSAMAAALMQLILDKIKARPELAGIVSYWECCNEPDPPGGIGYMQLANLMIECMDIADEHGLKLALFSLNAGTPEWDEMQAMVKTDVFARAKQGGHILALHEGVFDDQPIDQWYGDLIPGAPYVPGAGALCFRYRYLYHLLEQRGEVVPLVVSEFRTHGANYPISTYDVVRRWAWYDELARDDYLLGVTPFTLGARDQWFPSHDYGVDYPLLVDYAVNFIEPIEPPASDRGQPRVQYERTYVLLSPDGDADMVMEIARRFFNAFRPTVGGSADDSGIGDLDTRNVIAVQPDHWGDDLQAFFEQYYPGIEYLPAPGTNVTQVMGRVHASLLRARGVRFVYPSTHQPPLVTSEFGVDRGEYIHTGIDLRSSWYAYGDEILCAYPGTVLHVGYNELKVWAGYYIEILSVLSDNQKMITRYAHLVDGGAYVTQGQTVKAGDKLGRPGTTGNSTGDHIHLGAWIGNEPADPAILIDWEITPEPPVTVKAVIGLHDAGGLDWMVQNGLPGCGLVHRSVTDTPVPIDARAWADADVSVLARWNYGYADGTGTVPPPALASEWAKILAETINRSQGVTSHAFPNEVNNPAEWPGWPDPTFYVSPSYVLDLYEMVAELVEPGIALCPGPIDPYNVVAGQFGQPADPRTWFNILVNGASRVGGIWLHAKTQTNDPVECASDAKFTDAPLTDRYLHLRTYLDQLGWVREGLRGLPVFITELNPQRIDATRLGWVADNVAWINAAVAEIDRYNATGGQAVTGMCLYRWEADDWKLQDKPLLLDEIVTQSKR